MSLALHICVGKYLMSHTSSWLYLHLRRTSQEHWQLKLLYNYYHSIIPELTLAYWYNTINNDPPIKNILRSKTSNINRRIYIANFAIFKIAILWSYHLHLREKSRSFSFMKLRDFLVGSAHVRSQATVHAFMHAAHAVCMRAEDIDTRFKERA